MFDCLKLIERFNSVSRTKTGTEIRDHIDVELTKDHMKQHRFSVIIIISVGQERWTTGTM